ncbi:sarcoplasmic calcium-binding proteins I, III, and IV [Tetranychus urticae]|uniref:sarcoplasmic calcium-binding proteins I, III, and IV n=1 Tax=Tetranychus urticae TaxID=32264 RepID=UPI00077BC21B|nr:sarcoplasmic calcium-binding proteins I, III, and IV [Tetranychus urticae]
MDQNFFRHKHLFTFLNFWDDNGDGILSWEDFNQLAEKYTKLQRRGKLEKEVYDRWKAIFEKWWNQLTSFADYNADTFVEFGEWVQFFEKLGETTKSHQDLPDFLKTYLQLFFLCVDSNKDALFCLKDYKKYLTNYKMDVSRAEECFKSMLNEEDKANGNALTSDRFKELVYDFWVSKNPSSPGKYICGPFDSVEQSQMESKVQHKAM